MTAQDIHFETEIREYTPLDANYPERLRCIDKPPKTLYARGALPPDNEPAVAIIGARDGSDYGQEVARNFGRQLARNGVNIISGMAYGIDSAAQWGAIEGGGKTYAVFGCGLNICYPPSNFRLYEEILAHNGAVLSEQPLNAKPLGSYFATRNRIIAGLSDAVIVIEAKEHSGTSITVGDALQQGKQIFALPGRITDRLSFGCNRLIREGADILTSVEDVLEYLHLSKQKEQICITRNPQNLSKMQKKVYQALQEDALHQDYLLERTALSVPDLIMSLTELEILGYCESPKTGYYRRRSRLL